MRSTIDILFRWSLFGACGLTVLELIKPGFATHTVSLTWWWGAVIVLWLMDLRLSSKTHD